MTSYSEYTDDIGEWYNKNIDPHFTQARTRLLKILNEEDSLMEIVKLIGADVLPDSQRLIIEIARVIRVGFLQQNAMHPVDTYMPLDLQYKLMELILYLYDRVSAIVARAIPISQVVRTGVFDLPIKIKYEVSNQEIFDQTKAEIDSRLDQIEDENAESRSL